MRENTLFKYPMWHFSLKKKKKIKTRDPFFFYPKPKFKCLPRAVSRMKHLTENRLFPKSPPGAPFQAKQPINAGWGPAAHTWVTRHGTRALCPEDCMSLSETDLKPSLIMETLTQPAISSHDIKQAQSQQQWLGAREERLTSQVRGFRLRARRGFFFFLFIKK